MKSTTISIDVLRNHVHQTQNEKKKHENSINIVVINTLKIHDDLDISVRINSNLPN